jgi:AraC-type DNA-binding domain-containing proteins
LNIKIDVKSLEELMQSFYILTGIRIVIFDTEYHEVLSYPTENSKLCSILKSNPFIYEKCKECDLNSFYECRRKGELIIYKCHAGMVETATPLKENGAIIGYAMFGQIIDVKSKYKFKRGIAKLCKQYGLNEADAVAGANLIRYKSTAQIYAASRILEICTSYILLKELISIRNDMVFNKIAAYIEEHLSENITCENICSEFNLSRSSLYRISKANKSDGIASLIQNKRMEKAYQLIKNSDLKISDIASAVGFNDYNYFSKVFKMTYGFSPRKIRNKET